MMNVLLIGNLILAKTYLADVSIECSNSPQGEMNLCRVRLHVLYVICEGKAVLVTAHAWLCAPRLSAVWVPWGLFNLALPSSFLYVADLTVGQLIPAVSIKALFLRCCTYAYSDSLSTSSIALFARCKTIVPTQFIGWLLVHACSAMADLSVRLFMQHP